MAKTTKVSSPATKRPHAVVSQPTQEEIAFRAYQIYLERGGAPGNELEDWTRAERELLGKNGKPGRKPSPKSIAA
jgi:hypothetical protein